MVPTDTEGWKHSRLRTYKEIISNTKIGDEGNFTRLQNHPHGGNGDGVRRAISMDTSPDQSSTSDHAHAVTLGESSDSTLATQCSESQNDEHPTSIKSRKCRTTIPIYDRGHIIN
jgi:hypothetical protein